MEGLPPSGQVTGYRGSQAPCVGHFFPALQPARQHVQPADPAWAAGTSIGAHPVHLPRTVSDWSPFLHGWHALDDMACLKQDKPRVQEKGAVKTVTTGLESLHHAGHTGSLKKVSTITLMLRQQKVSIMHQLRMGTPVLGAHNEKNM